jgi:hypothetical protein
MPAASFRFGNGDIHELRMEFSWFGAERYYLGDTLIFKHWSLKPSGSREFTAAGHLIRVSLQIGQRHIGSQAYVDGLLRAEDLFCDLNRKLKQRRPWWVYIAIWLAVASVSFGVTVLVSR